MNSYQYTLMNNSKVLKLPITEESAEVLTTITLTLASSGLCWYSEILKLLT